MASTTPLSLVLLTLTPFLFFFFHSNAQTAPAPAPAGPVNLTGILAKNGQFTTFIRLLNETKVDDQIVNQLNSSTEGLTVFAPTDNAFQTLKAGALNDLNDQEKVQLILYHVLPKYYTLDNLQTVSNPVRTQAAGRDGPFGLNFTSQGNQLNVTTGVVETQINNALKQQFPLAVYQVDKVLLPEELFGTKSPTPAPAPEKTPVGSPKSKDTKAGEPSPADNNDNGSTETRVGWGLVVGLGLVCMGALS